MLFLIKGYNRLTLHTFLLFWTVFLIPCVLIKAAVSALYIHKHTEPSMKVLAIATSALLAAVSAQDAAAPTFFCRGYVCFDINPPAGSTVSRQMKVNGQTMPCMCVTSTHGSREPISYMKWNRQKYGPNKPEKCGQVSCEPVIRNAREPTTPAEPAWSPKDGGYPPTGTPCDRFLPFDPKRSRYYCKLFDGTKVPVIEPYPEEDTDCDKYMLRRDSGVNCQIRSAHDLTKVVTKLGVTKNMRVAPAAPPASDGVAAP